MLRDSDSPANRTPSALDHWSAIVAEISDRPLIIFLDYDGTLTPIVSHPDQAILSESMRSTLRHLASRYPTAIVSGRARADVESRVALPELTYVGSHGFDIRGPGPDGPRLEMGADYVPMLHEAAQHLGRQSSDIVETLVEEKIFSVSFHFRLVSQEQKSRAIRAFEDTSAAYPGLKVTTGKEVLELRPPIDWDKGRAVEWLLESHLNDPDQPSPTVVYLGDDVTDEDAFLSVSAKGIAILVAESARPTTARYRLRDVAEVEDFLTRIMALSR